MEHWVHSDQFLRQFHLVGSLANSLTNPVRSNIPWCQLSFHMEPDGASKWRDFEGDIVPNFKLKVPLPFIYVTLLSALNNSQILSHLGNSFLSILDLCGAKE